MSLNLDNANSSMQSILKQKFKYEHAKQLLRSFTTQLLCSQMVKCILNLCGDIGGGGVIPEYLVNLYMLQGQYPKVPSIGKKCLKQCVFAIIKISR